jgi:hypothetical protein
VSEHAVPGQLPSPVSTSRVEIVGVLARTCRSSLISSVARECSSADHRPDPAVLPQACQDGHELVRGLVSPRRVGRCAASCVLIRSKKLDRNLLSCVQMRNGFHAETFHEYDHARYPCRDTPVCHCCDAISGEQGHLNMAPMSCSWFAGSPGMRHVPEARGFALAQPLLRWSTAMRLAAHTPQGVVHTSAFIPLFRDQPERHTHGDWAFVWLPAQDTKGHPSTSCQDSCYKT